MKWPHAPVHRPFQAQTVMVTGGTYLKQHILKSPRHLTIVQEAFFEAASNLAMDLAAWSFLSNHYHCILGARDEIELRQFTTRFHGRSARELNLLDRTPGRRVWYQSWDRCITTQRSFMARMKYVMLNPEHHGVVRNATNYPWCSAWWFREKSTNAQYETLMSFKIDKVSVFDPYEVVAPSAEEENGEEAAIARD